MAWTKISELTELTTPTGEEYAVVAGTDSNNKVKIKNIWWLTIRYERRGWWTSASWSQTRTIPNWTKFILINFCWVGESETSYTNTDSLTAVLLPTDTGTSYLDKSKNHYVTISSWQITIHSAWFWTCCALFFW